jgi:hypothetical protein
MEVEIKTSLIFSYVGVFLALEDHTRLCAVVKCVLTLSVSPASRRGWPGSNPGLVMWDFVISKSGSWAGFL